MFAHLYQNIILKNPRSIFALLLIAILIAYPAGFILIDNLSPNSILFGLSVLLTAIGTKLRYKITSFHLLYGFLLGLAISIKYISLIIVLPLLVSLIFDSNIINMRATKAIKTIFFILLSNFSIAHVIITLSKGANLGQPKKPSPSSETIFVNFFIENQQAPALFSSAWALPHFTLLRPSWRSTCPYLDSELGHFSHSV